MKLLTLLICLAMASVAADSYSQQTKFNINANNITLKDIFRQIERESDFIFVYSENNLDLQRKVNSTYKNESLSKILDEIFAGTNNYYEGY
ncbi:MAG: STN domain-containing protein [Draconibacterium sp.]